MKKENKKTYIIFLVGFIISVILFTGTFFMYLNTNDGIIITENVGDKNEDMPYGIIFNSIDDSLHLEGVTPTLDKFGVLGKGFSFSIKNTGTTDIFYELSLKDDNSTISNNNIRYELTKNGNVLGLDTLSSTGILEKSMIKKGEIVNYTIKLWLDYNSEVIVGKLSKKIAIKEIVDSITSVNEPVLTNGLIPVYYDNSTNEWYKADSSNLNDKWYSYDNLKYANAITVNSNRRTYYEESSPDTKIDTLDINSMWVWIPRFNYSKENEKVNIKYVKTNEKAYPAFTFNNNELSGFWISKFEASMDIDSDCITSSLTKSCNTQNNLLYFVPNYPFATKMTMANMFYTIRKMELVNNSYGFNGTGNVVNPDGTIKNDKNNIDIHMIKNSEWDAVALLSYNNYKNILNNNSSFTGNAYYSDKSYEYNSLSKGELASTTTNLYGVYDMVGGKREYVMVQNEEINLFNKKSNSGFTTSVKDYYYDQSLSDTYNYGIDNKLNNEPVTRGGYKNTGNIFTIYGSSDYIDKVSVETNSRACLVIMEGIDNE